MIASPRPDSFCPPAIAVPPVPGDIITFVEGYRDAFNKLDGVAVAQWYAVPSGIASDTGYTHWPSREPVERNMVALCQLYRDNGFAAAQCAIERYLPQGNQYAVVDVHWRVDRVNGREPWVFSTTYNLMQTPQGWRVLLCTAYSEKPLNR